MKRMSTRCLPVSSRTMTSVDTYCEINHKDTKSTKVLNSLCSLWLILPLIILLTGCGRVGDPLPPIKHRALVPEALNVTQRGEELILSWPKPGVVVLQESKVVRADILRRDEKTSE